MNVDVVLSASPGTDVLDTRTSVSASPSEAMSHRAMMSKILRDSLVGLSNHPEDQVCQALRERFQAQGWHHFVRLDEMEIQLETLKAEKRDATNHNNYSGLGSILVRLSYNKASEEEITLAWSQAQPYLRQIARLRQTPSRPPTDLPSLEARPEPDLSSLVNDHKLLRAKLRRCPGAMGLLGGNSMDMDNVKKWLSEPLPTEFIGIDSSMEPRKSYSPSLLYLLIRIAAISYPVSERHTRRIVHVSCQIENGIFRCNSSMNSLPSIIGAPRDVDIVLGLEPGIICPTVYTYHPAENLFVFYVWAGQGDRDIQTDVNLIRSMDMEHASAAEVRHYRCYQSSHTEDAPALTVHLISSILSCPSPLPQGIYRSHPLMFGDQEPTRSQISRLGGLHVYSLLQELEQARTFWEAARAGEL